MPGCRRCPLRAWSDDGGDSKHDVGVEIALSTKSSRHQAATRAIRHGPEIGPRGPYPAKGKSIPLFRPCSATPDPSRPVPSSQPPSLLPETPLRNVAQCKRKCWYSISIFSLSDTRSDAYFFSRPVLWPPKWMMVADTGSQCTCCRPPLATLRGMHTQRRAAETRKCSVETQLKSQLIFKAVCPLGRERKERGCWLDHQPRIMIITLPGLGSC